MSVNSLSSSRIQMSGLVSGLDTEELVSQMSSAAKSKVDIQKQKLESLQWKQLQYRSVISSITSLKSKYFDLLTPKTNLSSASLFAARSVSSSSSELKVSASSSADKATYNITEIMKKAQSAEISGESHAVEGIRLDSNATQGEEYTVTVTLDGYAKDITFMGGSDKNITNQNFVSALNESFTSSKVEFSMENDRVTVKSTEYANLSNIFNISASDHDTDGLQALGLTSAVSNKLVPTTKLGDLCFTDNLSSNSFSFNINGENFSFSKNQTLNDVLNTVNNSDAEVKLSYDSTAGSFKLVSSNSGASSALSIKQTSGNLLSCMFGEDKIKASSTLGSDFLMSNGVTGDKAADNSGFGFDDGVSGNINDLINQKISVTINGVTKTIGLWSYNSSGVKNDFTNSANVLTQLNTELEKNFGEDAPVLSYDKDNKTFTFTASNFSDEITISAVEDTTGGSDKLLAALGINENNSTNIVTEDNLLSESVEGTIAGTLSFGDGKTITIDNSTTIKDLIDGSDGYISYEKGILSLKGIDIDGCDQEGKAFLASLFGDEYNYPGVPPTDMETFFEASGENAIVKVDGNVITSNTNSFTISGTTFDISDLAVEETNITVTTSSDTSDVADAIKSFVNDYNNLIGDLYSQITTKSNSKDYPPLTDDQKEKMSDNEVQLWEAKAKTGLLYQDDTIDSFLSKLRNSVSGFSSNGMTLVDIGITVSAVYSDRGKLILDETKLNNALESNEEKVTKFFTNSSTGISKAISSTIDSAVSTSYSSKGSLILLAGVDNTSTVSNNIISNQIKDYQDLIDSLQKRYETEQERYWNQFTQLETMMSTYNSQSSWLSSQFSS